MSEISQMKVPVNFTLLCPHTEQSLLRASGSLPVLEHPPVLVWVRSTEPCPGGLKHLQDYFCFRMCRSAY